MEDTHPALAALGGIGFVLAMPGFVVLAFLLISMFLVNTLSVLFTAIVSIIKGSLCKVTLCSYLFSLAASIILPTVVFILSILFVAVSGVILATLFWDSDKSVGYGAIGGLVTLLLVILSYFSGVAIGAVSGYKFISNKAVQSTT